MEKYILIQEGEILTPAGYFLTDQGECKQIDVKGAKPFHVSQLNDTNKNLFLITSKTDFKNYHTDS